MSKRVSKFIASHHLLNEGARVVVGLSGGADSVCLALMLYELGYEVVALHCNFHLRGEESMRDEHFVEALCLSQGWTFYKTDFDTEAWASQKKLSTEMAARELRYAWFEETRKAVNAEAIAVGHHEDDNVETLLMNLARGTGIKGLRGMQPKNGHVVRPLLCVKRSEVQDWLQQHGQAYVTDHTNLERVYGRNKIRWEVIPALEKVNSGAKRNIATTIENMEEVWKVYNAAMIRAKEECMTINERGEQVVCMKTLRQQASPISVLYECLAPMGFKREQLKEVLKAGCGKTFTANEYKLVTDRDRIVLTTSRPTPSPMPELTMETVPAKGLEIRKERCYAYLDADKLHGELTMRTPRHGDTFAPFGMGGRRKLLSDFLTDHKLNVMEKKHQPLLMDGEEIAWVVGLRSSELYRVDEHTRRVLILCLKS